MRLALVGLATMALAALACAGEPTGAPKAASAPVVATTATAAPPPMAPTRAQAFSRDRAWGHLEAQVAMGPRAQGLPGKEKLRLYLREHLVSRGATARELRFTHQGRDDAAPSEFVNVMGRFNPQAPRWILLGTHYDTRLWADEDPDVSRHALPIEGANDGASGTAVLLEIATVLAEHPPDIGVEIVFFDGEDYGRPGVSEDYFLGSQAQVVKWAELYGTSRPDAAVVLDMVGDADLMFRREAKAENRFRWLNDLLWRTGQELRLPAFSSAEVQGVTDDHDALMAFGLPATLLIDFDYPWWHHAGDTSDKCSPDSLAQTGRVLLTALVDRPLAAPAGSKP